MYIKVSYAKIMSYRNCDVLSLLLATLSFYIKPKAELSSKSVESQPVVKKRSRSATDAKDNNTKKPKLTSKSKTSSE